MIRFRLCQGKYTKAIFGFQVMFRNLTFQFVRGAFGVFRNTDHKWIIEAKLLNKIFR